MYCSKCGNLLGEQDKFCSCCGTKNEKYNNSDILSNELIRKAKNGDESAFDHIYHQTYRDIWKIAKSFFPDDATECDDCIQEIYLNLWEKLNYYDSDKGDFLPWFKKTAQNICVTHWNRKKKNNSRNASLDSMMISDDSDKGIDIKDERLDFNPEAVMDRNETSRLVQEILDDLPLQQKECLLLYYAAQYKQETIAEMLGIPKGTVKSRLFNGKKMVEEKVLALEKRGTKLYGMSPIVFFVWLFLQESEAQAANVAHKSIPVSSKSNDVLNYQSSKDTKNNETIASATMQTAAGTSIKGTAIKAIAVIAGVAAIGVGGFSLYKHLNDTKKEPVQETIVIDDSKDDSNANLIDKIDQNLVRKLLMFLPEYTAISENEVGAVLKGISVSQYTLINTGQVADSDIIDSDGFYYVPEDKVLEIQDDIQGNGSVDILYQKSAFEEVFDLLGFDASWESLQNISTISYLDEEKVGFTAESEKLKWLYSIELKNVESDTENVNVHFNKTSFYNGLRYYEDAYIAKICPADNSLGYKIASVQKVESNDIKASYGKLIDAYSNYYYNGQFTEGILTEEIINENKYGVQNPYTGFQFGYDSVQSDLYFGFIDINNDGYDECIFTSDLPDKADELFLYDIWTINDEKFVHVLPGYYRHFQAFCEDGTIMTFGSISWNSGGFKWTSFDNNGNVTEVDAFTYEDYDKAAINEKKAQHPITEKAIRISETPYSVNN